MTAQELWHVIDFYGDENRAVVNGEDELICDCRPDTWEDLGLPERENSRRHARLIAAAPTLLRALKLAQKNSVRRLETRQKWTLSDQNAHEAIIAAIETAT